MASRNKILAIFYPYTFSHNQGRERPSRPSPPTSAYPLRAEGLVQRGELSKSARSGGHEHALATPKSVFARMVEHGSGCDG
jgi:hypothetical protein